MQVVHRLPPRDEPSHHAGGKRAKRQVKSEILGDTASPPPAPGDTDRRLARLIEAASRRSPAPRALARRRHRPHQQKDDDHEGERAAGLRPARNRRERSENARMARARPRRQTRGRFAERRVERAAVAQDPHQHAERRRQKRDGDDEPRVGQSVPRHDERDRDGDRDRDTHPANASRSGRPRMAGKSISGRRRKRGSRKPRVANAGNAPVVAVTIASPSAREPRRGQSMTTTDNPAAACRQRSSRQSTRSTRIRTGGKRCSIAGGQIITAQRAAVKVELTANTPFRSDANDAAGVRRWG